MRRLGLCRVRLRFGGALAAALVLTSGCGPAPSSSSPAVSTRETLLADTVVVLDPGHDGGNGRHPEVINRLVDTPLGSRRCDTAGAETDAGYPEHAFTWDLAQRLARLLTTAGAQVVLTRASDDGVGPCTVDRAGIGNRATAHPGAGVRVVALSLHADGGPPYGAGFHVIVPAPVGRNDAIVEPSRRLGTAVRDAFHAGTGERYSSYVGTQGITARTDIVALDLSTIPMVFIECGNMRNAQDAARLADPAWRQRAAKALERGLGDYLADK